jgi:hypothetical protein
MNDAVIRERFGTISRLVFSLPGLRLVARRSAWVRRVFGLETSSTPAQMTGRLREASAQPPSESIRKGHGS